MSIDVSYDPTAFERPKRKYVSRRKPREQWAKMGRPVVYLALTPDTVRRVYFDERKSLRAHALDLDVPQAALKAAIHRLGLHGRHWRMPKTRKAA